MRAGSAWLGLAVVVVAAAAGCGEDLPKRHWASAHFDYFSRDGDDTVCEDLLGQLEAHQQVITTALAIEPQPVTYYKFAGIDDFEENADCGDGFACAPGASVRSPVGFDRHELVHAYLFRVGYPPWMLLEGAAVALSCQRYVRPAGSWRDLFALDHGDTRQYGAGGWLAAALLRGFDPALFVRLYREAGHGLDAGDFGNLFEMIYGVPLDQVWADLLAAPDVPTSCPWECTRPAFPFGGGTTTPAPVCGVGSQQLTFDLTADADTLWTMVGDGWFFLRSCDGFEQPATSFPGSSGPAAALVPLRAGRHFVDASLSAEGGFQMSGATAAGASASTDCAAAPPLALDLGSLETLAVFYPSAPVTRFTNLGAGTSGGGFLRLLGPLAADVRLCAGCGDTACATVPAGSGRMVDAVVAGARLEVPGGDSVTAIFNWF